MNTNEVMSHADEVMKESKEIMKDSDIVMKRAKEAMRRSDKIMKEAEEFIGMFYEACQTFQRTNDLQAFDEILEYARINGKI